MSRFRDALWEEALNARRSRVPALTALAFSLAPLVGGLFMVILMDPARARAMGLISQKAQLVGAADWPTFFGLIAQATAVGGALVFAFAAAWVFGREFADHTAKELLALPVSRASSVTAKFAVLPLWTATLTALVLAVGTAVGLPGWLVSLAWQGAGDVAISAGLTLAVTMPVALLASMGRGYLPGLA
ncbi:MAG TPA: ABC transporter permease [Rhodothermales bacterium]|nr:ABC transporter permease [Rhodothermales bacterium]